MAVGLDRRAVPTLRIRKKQLFFPEQRSFRYRRRVQRFLQAKGARRRYPTRSSRTLRRSTGVASQAASAKNGGDWLAYLRHAHSWPMAKEVSGKGDDGSEGCQNAC
jgi:hypothetical protein